MTRVTVIVPTFQRGALIGRALRSVLSQTYADLQVCVYDNASTDNTAEEVRKLATGDARLRYHRRSANIGAFANFNDGMAHVETEFFSFLSDDDIIYPNFLELAVSALDANPDAMMFAGSTLELNDEGGVQYAPVARWPREGRYDPPSGAWQMLDNKHPTWTGVLFRRAVIDRIGLLDAGAGTACDLEYELHLAAQFPIVVSYQACAAYIRHEQAGSERQDTSVIAGYRYIASKVAQDASLPARVRTALAKRLEKQLQMKLIEIAAKATMRQDDVTAADAVRMLAHEPVTLAGVIARCAIPICVRVPAARAALQRIDRVRRHLRAKSAQRLDARARRKDTGGAQRARS